jgi:putative ABC transport system substrate-binding protein
MRRREFITFLGGAAAAWPLVSRAQQRAMSVIGFVSSRSSGESAVEVAAFREGLKEKGFVEGNNLAIAFRWAEGHYEAEVGAAFTTLVQQDVGALVVAADPFFNDQREALVTLAAQHALPANMSGVNSLPLVAW